MDNLSFVVGVLGNFISVLVFLSPIETFCRIVRNQSTQEFKSLPYICTLLNTLLWSYYGVTKPGAYLVATINGFGVVVETIYIILFLTYASRRVKCKTIQLVVVLDIISFAAAVLITHFALEGDVRIDAIGCLGAGLNIVMYGSPLAAMKTVVTTKSVKYMPFFLSFFLLLNGVIWCFYAILVKDPFIGVPNGIGVILGILQLALYARYRNSTNTTSSSVDSLLEQGSSSNPLLLPSPLPATF
ncbi:hypothetical protein MKX01_017583 [Papaver californicum]|nr:hypothetical protein MKX01_017583 [Papaver californicum]